MFIESKGLSTAKLLKTVIIFRSHYAPKELVYFIFNLGSINISLLTERSALTILFVLCPAQFLSKLSISLPRNKIANRQTKLVESPKSRCYNLPLLEVSLWPTRSRKSTFKRSLQLKIANR
jgi:hypothetical protein